MPKPIYSAGFLARFDRFPAKKWRFSFYGKDFVPRLHFMRKNKRLLYVPGLISLFGLPILLFIWGPPDPVEEVSLRVNIPSDDYDPPPRPDQPEIMRFNRSSLLRELKGRKLENVDLDAILVGSPYPDRRLAFIASELERLQFTFDTSTIVCVHLEGSTYGQFVWLLNQAIIMEWRRYVFTDDAFYYLPDHRTYQKRETEELYLPAEGYYEPSPPPTKWELFERRLEWWWIETSRKADFLWRYNRILILGFILLILLPGSWRLFRRARGRPSPPMLSPAT